MSTLDTAKKSAETARKRAERTAHDARLTARSARELVVETGRTGVLALGCKPYAEVEAALAPFLA